MILNNLARLTSLQTISDDFLSHTRDLDWSKTCAKLWQPIRLDPQTHAHAHVCKMRVKGGFIYLLTYFVLKKLQKLKLGKNISKNELSAWRKAQKSKNSDIKVNISISKFLKPLGFIGIFRLH